jgi:hypothetical protein
MTRSSQSKAYVNLIRALQHILILVRERSIDCQKKGKENTQRVVIGKMENYAIKSLKLPLFDGTSAKFQILWVRFKAFASVSGFWKVLGSDIKTVMPPTELTVIDENDAGALHSRKPTSVTKLHSRSLRWC